jgi:hypothetical protein
MYGCHHCLAAPFGECDDGIAEFFNHSSLQKKRYVGVT